MERREMGIGLAELMHGRGIDDQSLSQFTVTDRQQLLKRYRHPRG